MNAGVASQVVPTGYGKRIRKARNTVRDFERRWCGAVFSTTDEADYDYGVEFERYKRAVALLLADALANS